MASNFFCRNERAFTWFHHPTSSSGRVIVIAMSEGKEKDKNNDAAVQLIHSETEVNVYE
jgi:hypothetical protein